MHGPHLVMLMRHGIAENANASGRDADRVLTAEGKRKTREVVAGMRALALPVDAILTSPLARTRQTAAIVAEAYDLEEQEIVVAALGPAGGPDVVVRSLEKCGAAPGIVLVGHEPDLGEIASTLLTGSQGLVYIPFKKAAVIGISVTSLPPKHAGVLEFFMSPTHLRRIGRVV